MFAVIVDPKTKQTIFKPSEILRISADYCQNLLTNKTLKEKFREDSEQKKIVHEVRTKEVNDNDPVFTHEMLMKL